MWEINNSNDMPFMCLEVNSFNNPNHLANRFDELFPNRIIRLIIDKKYSSIFYLGNGVWVSKKNMTSQPQISFKIAFDDCIEDFFDTANLDLIQHLEICYENLKVVSDLTFGDVYFAGVFFSDGFNHILDEYMILEAKEASKMMQEKMNAQLILDLSNEENGLIILKTEKNIFGEIYE